MNSVIVDTDLGTLKLYTNDAVNADIINGTKYPYDNMRSVLNIISDNTKVMLDIGSNLGTFSLYCKDKFKKIYSFEPQKLIFEQLQENLRLNSVNNIHIKNIALGDKTETFYMDSINYDEQINSGDLSISYNKIGEAIEINKGDELFSEFDNIQLIKIDVQGYELNVLNGLENTIRNNKPYLIIEVEEHQLKRFDISPTDLYNKLTELGYFYRHVKCDYLADVLCVTEKDMFHKFEGLLT